MTDPSIAIKDVLVSIGDDLIAAFARSITPNSFSYYSFVSVIIPATARAALAIVIRVRFVICPMTRSGLFRIVQTPLATEFSDAIPVLNVSLCVGRLGPIAIVCVPSGGALSSGFRIGPRAVPFTSVVTWSTLTLRSSFGIGGANTAPSDLSCHDSPISNVP
jgi:hypothetical protein